METNVGPDRATIERFLQTLYGAVENHTLVVWRLRDQLSRSFSTDNLTAAAEYIEAEAARGDVYFNTGLYAEPLPADKRGDEAGVTCVVELHADVDLKRPGHVDQSRPETAEGALAVVREATGLEPSLIVDSGGGLHVYWLLREPLDFFDATDREAAKAASVGLQATIRAAFGARGWTLDKTHDLGRILRPAGTVNRKPGLPPRPVRVFAESAVRYNPSDFERFVQTTPVAAPAPVIEEVDDPRRVERATRYLQTCEPAVEGQGGHARLWAAALHVRRGLALSRAMTIELLETIYNPRCSPPWSRRELEHKVDDAGDKAEVPLGFALVDPPVINTTSGYVGTITTLSLQALATNPGPFPLYQRGGDLVHLSRVVTEMEPRAGVSVPKGSFTISVSTVPYVAARLSEAARFRRPVRGRNGDFEYVAADPPPAVVSAIVAQRGNYPVPPLFGVSTTPILRDDGTLATRPGHDKASGYWLAFGRDEFPAIPDNPTEADARRALDLLDDLLAEFPFHKDAKRNDRSAALAAILTGVIRSSLPTAPGFAVDKNASGVGGSCLADLIGLIATGRELAASGVTDSEAEMEKRIHALLRAGVVGVRFDNVECQLKGEALARLLSERKFGGRVLGATQNEEYPTRLLCLFNGINLEIHGDLVRRVVPIRLVSELEQPETRRFRRPNLLTEVGRDRAKLVSAALTVIRAYLAAGWPGLASLPSLVGYDRWSETVRGPICWLGHPDPILGMEATTAADPQREAVATLYRVMYLTRRFEPFRAKDVAELLLPDTSNPTPTELVDDLREALDELDVMGRDGVNLHALGHALKKLNDRRQGGYKLTVEPDSHTKRQRFRVRKVE